MAESPQEIFKPEATPLSRGKLIRTGLYGLIGLALLFGALTLLQLSGVELTENFKHLNWSLLGDVLGYDRTSPLLFNTGLFMLLFAAFIGIYRLAASRSKARMYLVIAFSLYFYIKSSPMGCVLLLAVCMADFIIGTLLFYCKSSVKRRLYVLFNVLMNAGMLLYFKYFNMVFGFFAGMAGAHFEPFDIILPIGVSFFCFRSISYIVDIYRGKIEPCRSLRDYIFFLTFFPPLLAGPVVRASDMLPQIARNPIADRRMVSEGLFMIMCGLFKKIIIADYLSGNFVQRIFENPSLYSGFENLMGVLGFSIQIYCDFSGYSDMAIGIALLMGYRFLDNFDSPFKSTNPSDFWRRWHISLSSWLRDYIYIPLGGNRKGKPRQYCNLFITMIVGGIWHEGVLMNILWGFYNGILLTGHKILHKVWRTPARIKGTRTANVVNIAVTFTLIIVGMAIFKSTSIESFGVMCKQIFTNFHPSVIPSFIMSYKGVVLLMLLAYVLHFMPKRLTARVRDMFGNQSLLMQAIILALVIFVVIQSRQAELVPFIYLKY